MIFKHDGLSDLGSEEGHWKAVDVEEARRHGLHLQHLSSFNSGSHAVAYNHEEVDVDLGWDDKREVLIKHYILALQAGEVARLQTREERGRQEEGAEV
mmetsp:Transcript_27177/g.76667  ORF Transcript_27177/g.76667 Transcript_27177/m.76667 type:complete len:98 (+) Transcript_27177:577-870(+)